MCSGNVGRSGIDCKLVQRIVGIEMFCEDLSYALFCATM